MCLVLLGLDVPVLGGTHAGLHFYEEKKRGNGGGFCKSGTGRTGGRGLRLKYKVNKQINEKYFIKTMSFYLIKMIFFAFSVSNSSQIHFYFPTSKFYFLKTNEKNQLKFMLPIYSWVSSYCFEKALRILKFLSRCISNPYCKQQIIFLIIQVFHIYKLWVSSEFISTLIIFPSVMKSS